ncbi:MAG: 50S ribosomal protein L10 [Candidatus Altiarchaeota archaeon]|nr:50S ribosomal protein L10 [Candidatus Altiarchaeota archaeon]
MVATWKIKEVENLAGQIKESKVVGLMNINGIPSKQFQEIRRGLRGKAELKVTKNSIIKRALEKKKLDLGGYVQGQTGIIFTDLDPFKLSKLMSSTKTSVPAKPGNIANKDIIIPAGDTPFKPGPIIGELQKAGIKAKIEGGKIVVTEDSLVVRGGEVISADLANVLGRLGVEPMEICPEINAVYDGEVVYTGDILRIDDEKTVTDLQNAYQQSLNLALNAEVHNSVTVNLFLRKAFSDAISLAVNTEVINKESIGFLLSKADMEMHSLASRIPEGLGDEMKASVSPAPEEKDEGVKKEGKTKEPGKEEKASEEEAASGLASLFD